MELAVKVMLGAAVGAAVGFAIGRARACSGRACNVKATLVYSIVAGAVFGAAMMWFFITR